MKNSNNHGDHMEQKWEKILLDHKVVVSEELTPKGNGLILTLNDGRKLLLTKERMKNWRTLEKPVQASIIKSDKGELWNVGVLASLDFCAIPHSILFSFVEDTLKSLGIDVKSKEWRKWFTRTGMLFNVKEIPLEYGRPKDALKIGLLVTNANTTQDSIRIFPYSEILLCKNGLTNLNFETKLIVYHKGTIDEVLKKVRYGVITAVNALPFISDYAGKLQKLGEHSITTEEFDKVVSEISKISPIKTIIALRKSIQYNREIFGDTPLALVQALSRVYSYPNMAENLQRKLITYTNECIKRWDTDGYNNVPS